MQSQGRRRPFLGMVHRPSQHMRKRSGEAGLRAARSVDFRKGVVNIDPWLGRRGKVPLENGGAVAHARAHCFFDLFQVHAALPACLEMGAQLVRARPGNSPSEYRSNCSSLAWGITRPPHRSPFFNLAMARRRNSPTAEALIPSADPISGYRRPSSRSKRQRLCCSESPWMA